MPNPPATLLIVDDEPSIRLSLSLLLTEIGYGVRCAEDGFSALREIRNEVPELLLSDLNMPGMSGFELLSVVRRRFPAIQTIAMSGAFSGDEVPSGVAADAFYQKGSSIHALLRIMDALPQMERSARQPISADGFQWFHGQTHIPSPNASTTITCPECLRAFPEALATGTLRRNTNCIYCRSSIYLATALPADRMRLQSSQQKGEAAMRSPKPAPNSSL